MKRMKKLFAMLLAFTMILGMTMTSNAASSNTAPYNSVITVRGLADNVETTVKLYEMVSLDETENSWNVKEWAEEFVAVVCEECEKETCECEKDTTTVFKLIITDLEALKEAVPTDEPTQTKEKVVGTTTTFTVPVGAYVVMANDTEAVYNIMVANTYDVEATYMASKDATVVAKASGYEVKKEADDEFVAKGQEVNFTVTTTFPSFPADSVNKSYKIIDAAKGLNITSVESILIGGEEFKERAICGYVDDAETEVLEYVINLTEIVGDDEEHAGKTVVVTYKATVTTDDGYVNTVNAFRDDVELDPEPPTIDGFTGDITVTKYASDDNNNDLTDNTTLKGAEFKVYHATKDAVKADGSTVKALYFTETKAGYYELAKEDDENATQTIKVDDNGVVKVKGLEAGNYWFEETKAPLGYSINEDGVAAEIKINADDATADPEAKELNINAHVSVTKTLVDTKLIALPSTGGIGTTIFTVAGCGIMIAAAFFFFAGRKKEEN